MKDPQENDEELAAEAREWLEAGIYEELPGFLARMGRV